MRKQPYTKVGLARCKCVRCGDAACEQWNVNSCSAGVYWGWLPLCTACDLALNALVRGFFGR